MRKPRPRLVSSLIIFLVVLTTDSTAFAGESEESERDSEKSRESEEQKDEYEKPALPEEMTLDEVLDRAAEEPPDDYPDSVPDDNVHAFLLGEQFEYRFDGIDDPNELGLELQGWFGGDYDKLWWKNDSEGAVRKPRGLETETDLLYARLMTPFFYGQIGAQYANEWNDEGYEDRWSGVVAFQGTAPGMFEVDVSTYVSENANVTFEMEAEYDLRITQRLVFQPLVDVGFAAQDIPDRNIGAGLTDAIIDLRLRYEIKREFAPYLGGRWRVLVGETADRAEAAGEDPSRLMVLGGLRFAIL